MTAAPRLFDSLGLRVLERGWLSSNNIVFAAVGGDPATVVDTGYDRHRAQTVDLIRQALDGRPPERVLNTHLHSDHCGGNAALQAAFDVQVVVPEVSLDAVRSWDAARLTFDATGQRCDRFSASGGLASGDAVSLAGHRWEVLAAPGHDPEALMLFQRDSRVLISADALWEARLAIVFPELEGRAGFDSVRTTLDTIAALDPVCVIPGHGAPFGDVRRALQASRSRLAQFEAEPERHTEHALRALLMFHLLERRDVEADELEAWALTAPVFEHARQRWRSAGIDPREQLQRSLHRMVSEQHLRRDGSRISVP